MPVRYGIIGCGAIAQRRHIPECVANPRSELVALVDPNESRVRELAAKYEARAHADYRALLEDRSIDAVVICSPNAFHARQTIDAFEAGKHVLVEKPMATTRDEARAMLAAAERSGRFLMVAQNQRLMPPHVKAREILSTGKLGRPLTFRTTFKHPGPEGWSVDGAQSWFFDKQQAALGVLGDLGIHKADLLRYLLGQEFDEVCGFIGTLDKTGADGRPIPLDDNAFLTLRTAEGVIGSMMISWTNYGGMEDNATTIFCAGGVLSIGADPRFGVIVSYRDGTGGGGREYHELGAIATNTRQVNSGVIDAFTRSIESNTKPTIDGMEGYRSLDVVLTAMEAAQQGRTLKIGGR